mmetsp:Transcript_8748/g.17336  ORF Transcript_8748/g.17336 Transcript_8748/m.17336 type:complete len:228 (-) Transcript_8748:320-1003(-)
MGGLAARVVAVGALRQEHDAPLRDAREVALASSAVPHRAARARPSGCRGAPRAPGPGRAALLLPGLRGRRCSADAASGTLQDGKALPLWVLGQPSSRCGVVRGGEPAEQQVSHGRAGDLAQLTAHLSRALGGRRGGRRACEVPVLIPVLLPGGLWHEQGVVLLCGRPRKPAGELGSDEQPRLGARWLREVGRGWMPCNAGAALRRPAEAAVRARGVVAPVRPLRVRR